MGSLEPAIDRLVGFGAIAGAVGGALRIAAACIPYGPDAAWLEALYAACDLGMLFGLVAVYLATAERVGRAGLVTFAVGFAALASIVGPDAHAFGVDFHSAGATVFALALAAFAVTLLVAQTFVIAGALWIACGTLGAAASATGSGAAFVSAGLALGAGFIAAAVSLVRSRRAGTTAPV